MTLRVSVPVLSVRTKSIWPRSSLMAVLLDRAVPPICTSHSMTMAYQYLHVSRETLSEMGIMSEQRSM